MTETSAPGVAEVLRAFAQGAASQVRVARAGVVVAVDRPAARCDVQLLVDETTTLPTGEVRSVEAPLLRGVSIGYQYASGHGFTFGVSAGDLVDVIIRDVSHDEVRQGRRTRGAPAARGRRWSPADAYVIPLSAAPGTIPASAIRSDGAPVLSLASGEALHVGAATAARALALAQEVRDEFQAHVNIYNAHKHTGVTTGPGSSGVPDTPMTAPPDLGSTRIKVDA